MTITEEMTEAMVDDKLAQFEQRISAQMGTMTSSMADLASSVRMLADRDIRMQERESQQQSFNARIGASMDVIANELKIIQLSRAEEKHAVEAVKKSYVWIVILGVLGPVILTAVSLAWVNSATKSSSSENRAVIPLVQEYNPQNPPRNIQSSPAPKR